jgi:hypothetical protein
MKNVSSGSFLALEDLQGLQQEVNLEVVTGDFPTCWEMEVMDNGSTEDGEDENADVYARYVSLRRIVLARIAKKSFFDVILAFGCRTQRWPWDSREATEGLRYVPPIRRYILFSVS